MTPRRPKIAEPTQTDMLIGAIICLAIVLALCAPLKAQAHEIYTGLHGKNGQLCCVGDDCAATIYRERGGGFEFLTREGVWVAIPVDSITFLPVPGDAPSDNTHHAHLCYRGATDGDRTSGRVDRVFGPIFLYCAFVPPGAT
jgi:hypothetical protein